MAYTYDTSLLGGYANAFQQNQTNINDVYNASLQAIAGNDAVQNTNFANNKSAALKTLEGSNANAYATYKKTINANNNPQYGSNVSNYLKNASMNTYLAALGANQNTYNTSMANANSLWTEWLASKLESQASAESARQTNLDNLYQYYMGQKRSDDEAAETKRQFDAQMAYNYDALSKYSSGYGSSSSTYDPYTFDDNNSPNPPTFQLSNGKRKVNTPTYGSGLGLGGNGQAKKTAENNYLNKNGTQSGVGFGMGGSGQLKYNYANNNYKKQNAKTNAKNNK